MFLGWKKEMLPKFMNMTSYPEMKNPNVLKSRSHSPINPLTSNGALMFKRSGTLFEVFLMENENST